MAGETYRLIVRRGPQPNQSFDLTRDIITLGRDITNDIVINDPEVSRHHLRLTRGTDGYNIEDLGSTNGTFLGGQRLSGVRALKRGDMIGLGETVTLSYDMARPVGEGMDVPAVTAPNQPQYAPPQPQQAQQPSYSPQQPQQPQQPQYASPQQQQPSYDAPPPPDYGYGQQQPEYGYGPQVPGYDYDPYAIREDEPVSAWRWVVIGCAGMALFCCCATVLTLLIVDSANLWCDIPIFKDTVTPIISAFGEALGVVTNGGC